MRNRDHKLLAAALLAIALIASGCGNSSSPTNVGAISQDDADDLAVLGVAAMNQVGLDAKGSVGMPGGPMASSQSPIARPGVGPMAALWDTSYVRDGLTIEASRNFYDSGDLQLAQYGPDAVKLVWTSRIFGTVEMPRDTATVGHIGSLEVRGIQPTDTAFVINGAGADSLMNRFRSYDGTRTRYFYWNSALTIVNVIERHVVDGYPLSGTVTFVVQADRLRSNSRADVEAHLRATIVVTFNGTNTPIVTVNSSRSYHWNMATGELIRA